MPRKRSENRTIDLSMFQPRGSIGVFSARLPLRAQFRGEQDLGAADNNLVPRQNSFRDEEPTLDLRAGFDLLPNETAGLWLLVRPSLSLPPHDGLLRY